MSGKEILAGLLIALFLAIFITPFASEWPDGLEKVAEEKGFIKAAEEPLFRAPLADYTWPAIKSDKLSASFSGIAGTLMTFFLAYGASYVLNPVRKLTRRIKSCVREMVYIAASRKVFSNGIKKRKR
ncbi:MAG: PDGLE domain-containing protein [Candidatus Omnitrophota bacterium]